MKNIAAKKRARHKDVDSDYLFGDCSQRAVSRFGCGKSKVIKQTSVTIMRLWMFVTLEWPAPPTARLRLMRNGIISIILGRFVN
jgi:hypothetical protein